MGCFFTDSQVQGQDREHLDMGRGRAWELEAAVLQSPRRTAPLAWMAGAKEKLTIKIKQTKTNSLKTRMSPGAITPES